MRFGRDDARIAAGLAVLCLAGFLIYWPAIHGPFVWDDWHNIADNPLIRGDGGLLNFWLGREGTSDYYPLTWTTWWLEWRAWRRETTGYHVLNVLLHVAAAGMLWRVLVRLGVPGAYVAACLFLVHPVNVESVAWISERKNTLSMPLLCAALALFLDADEGRGRRGLYWAAVGVFLLSLLAKPSGVMLPAVLLAVAWWRRERITRADLKAVLPFALLAVVFAAVTVVVHHTRGIVTSEVRTDGFGGRLAGAGWAVWFYLDKLLRPVHLSLIYPRWAIDPRNLLHWLPVAGLVGAFVVLFAARRVLGRGAVVALACYVAMLLPVLGFVDVYVFRFSLVTDHFQYHACPAVFAAAAAAGARVLRRAPAVGRVAGPAAAVAACGVLACLAWREAHLWRAEAAIWADVLRENPDGPIALTNYASFHFVPAGRFDDARRMYQRALELEPRWREPYVFIGNSYLRQGNPSAAIPWFRKAVGVPGGGRDPRERLAEALLESGAEEEAVEVYEAALAADPERTTFRRRLASLHERAGRTARALELYRLSAEASAGDPEAWFVFALASLRHGRHDEAASALAEARRLTGGDHALVNAMGSRLMVAGHPEIAAEAFEEAVRMNRNYGPAHNKLGEAMLALGRREEAAGHFERALEVQPGFRQAAENLRLVRGGVTTLPASTQPAGGGDAAE